MIRILLIGILLYLLYRLLKNVFTLPGGRESRRFRKAPSTERIKDEMVKDPVCQVYVPMREAVSKVIQGERHYFCSEECRNRFMEQQKKPD